MIFELLAEAVKNTARNALRSILTMLGIVLGVGSVTALVSLSESSTQQILDEIGVLGIKNIIINAEKPPEEQNVKEDKNASVLRYGITFRDAARFEETLPLLTKVLPVHDVEQQWIWFKSRRIPGKIRGVTPGYLETMSLHPAVGRTLNELDEADQRRVCVIPQKLLIDAGYIGNPLKLDLKIGNQFFRVVGILPSNEFHSHHNEVMGVDEKTHEVYVPFSTVLRRYGVESFTRRAGNTERSRVELHQIVCEAIDESVVLDAARCVLAILEDGHDKKDYSVTVPVDMIASRAQAQKRMSTLLAIIGGISLVVGGIGVLNIMLANVTERTREIGIRRAIGATRFDITLQFLVETMTLSLVGGLIGIPVGIAGTFLLAGFVDAPPHITPWAVVVSLVVSSVTGIVVGIYPARRAAKLDPINALRHE